MYNSNTWSEVLHLHVQCTCTCRFRWIFPWSCGVPCPTSETVKSPCAITSFPWKKCLLKPLSWTRDVPILPPGPTSTSSPTLPYLHGAFVCHMCTPLLFNPPAFGSSICPGFRLLETWWMHKEQIAQRHTQWPRTPLCSVVGISKIGPCITL